MPIIVGIGAKIRFPRENNGKLNDNLEKYNLFSGNYFLEFQLITHT
ncbi:hypothetical protein H1P_3320002 [Hyella patelloides LEGE 07179]|uniref:Uncharacterized protein n=1 Tax=Hyella patelloides LEGE 07179 TaxID=945734 RepID=A0A563VVB6_9CYAN|nr:hypothetical protein H1P_3320002 [Hyella patelloides LEGE 07179]